MVSAMAMILKTTVMGLVEQGKRELERLFFVVVEVNLVDDPKLFQQVVTYLYDQEVFRPPSYRAISKATEEGTVDPFQQHHRNNKTVVPKSLGQDVALLPSTSQGSAARFVFCGESIWCRCEGTTANSTNKSEIGALVVAMAHTHPRALRLASGGLKTVVFSMLRTRKEVEALELIRRFLKDAVDASDVKHRKHVQVYDFHAHRHPQAWQLASLPRKRPPASVVLKDGVMNDILDDVQRFVNDESWYVKRHLPHRRGYLLHGPPGNGKSSVIMAVASHFGWPLCSVSLARLRTAHVHHRPRRHRLRLQRRPPPTMSHTTSPSIIISPADDDDDEGTSFFSPASTSCCCHRAA